MSEAERLLWVCLLLGGWLGVSFLCLRSKLLRKGSVGKGFPCNGHDALSPESGENPTGHPARVPLLVAYASQSGTAARLARFSAEALQPFHPVRLMSLDLVDEGVLSSTRQALFVASTYGEGEPPDNGIRFQRRYLAEGVACDLSHLEFAVLALGDRAYQRFCDFGRRLQVGLERLGARPLCDLTETDSGELLPTDSLPAPWWRELSRLAPLAAQPIDVTRRGSETVPGHWLLATREQLNAGSPGAPIYQLQFSPVAGLPVWRAGDIVQIQPRNNAAVCRQWLAQRGLDGDQAVVLNGVSRPLRAWLAERQLTASDDKGLESLLLTRAEHWLPQLPLLPRREYSAASVPGEHSLKLLVRQQYNASGEPGLGSGWLTVHATGSDIIEASIRNNPAFHGPKPERPLILVGSGSGLAGLRAHLAERLLSGRSGPNWLLFGERTRRHDGLLNAELQGWCDSGHLSRLDRVFSRDTDEGGTAPRYVQDLLLLQADELRQWIRDGAALFVCGSLSGMAAGVHQALEDILGVDVVDSMRASGLYRRDVY